MLHLKKYLNYYLICFINIVYIFLRLPDFYRPLWNDELISLRTITISPFSNPLYDGISTNLPFYYYILKIFSLFFSNENLRISSLFISIIVVNIFLYRFLKENDYIYVIVGFLISISPIQIYYSTELRTYMLTELFLILQFFYLKDYIQGKRVNFYLWGLTIFFSLISHYTAYIFVFSSIIYLLIKEKKISESLIKSYVIASIAGILVLILISSNSGFTDSTDNSILNLDFSRYSLFNFRENILRLIEVLTIYYNFGLHYYRLDSDFTSLFKKFMYFFFLIPLFWTFLKNRFQNLILNLVSVILFLCLILAILFDLSGFIIFAGRYIFPFHFLYLFMISIVLYEMFKLNKYLFVVLISVFIVAYNLYNTCLYTQLDVYKGNNDPQGQIVQSCFK